MFLEMSSASCVRRLLLVAMLVREWVVNSSGKYGALPWSEGHHHGLSNPHSCEIRHEGDGRTTNTVCFGSGVSDGYTASSLP